jgi:Tfp pilus assembly protein PilX
MMLRSMEIIRQIARRLIRSGREGNALVITLLITLALSGLALGALVSTQTEMRLTSNQAQQQKAFYLTERGMEESIAHLAQLGAPLVGSGAGGGPVALYTDMAVGDGTYTAWADPMDSNSGSSTRFVTVTVRGTLAGTGVSRAVQIKLGQQNFSRYSYFTDMELSASGSTIWFVDWDEFFGPVHSNDQLHIYGSPMFHDEVSSGASSVAYWHGGPPQDNPTFEMGLTLDAPSIPLPINTDLLKAKGQQADGLHISGNPVAIEMFVDAGTGDGKLQIGVNGGATTDYDIPSNGVLYVSGKATIKGTLKGNLTLGCDGDIEIMDNCVYDTDPRTDPSSTDLLGLVSEQDIFMDGNPAGPNADVGDETVMAAIMALGTSFTVENYSSGSPRGNLVIYGGLIQQKRGPVGTFNPSTHQIVSGYGKDYSYDSRLMDNPPPSFPTTGEMDKISWTEIDPSTDITANFW